MLELISTSGTVIWPPLSSFSESGTFQGVNQGTGALSLLSHLVPSARAFDGSHAWPPGAESEALFASQGALPCGRTDIVRGDVSQGLVVAAGNQA